MLDSRPRAACRRRGCPRNDCREKGAPWRPSGSAEHELVAEIQTDAAVPHPADESVDPRAMLELHDHAFPDAGAERAFDHRSARGDVDDGDGMNLAAEIDNGIFDQADLALLRSL